jgi:phage N-6-adenine-methyltransferase
MTDNNALTKLDKATQMLAEAKTLDEVKYIVDIAEAARTYARAAKLGIQAANHAAEIKLRAERKAGEMLAQLSHGDHGGDRKSSSKPENLNEFKEVIEQEEIPQSTAYKWETVAAIPEKRFEQHIAEVIETGGELTTAGLLKAAKAPHVSNNSGENEWYTPIEFIACARAVMGRIDLDPASSEIANKTVGASMFYTIEDDGLSKFWAGKVWMNPPYSSDCIGKFIAKYAEHVRNGDISEGIVLVNNATETNWFNELISVSTAVVFPNGRIRFIDKTGKPSGAPLQGQAIVYSGKNPDKFTLEFGEFGWSALTC